MKKLELHLETIIFRSRWLLAPFYAGLILAILALLVKFSKELVNLTLNAPDVWGGLSIAGSVYNALDEDYGDVGSEEHIQTEIPQDGRTYRLKAYYRF